MAEPDLDPFRRRAAGLEAEIEQLRHRIARQSAALEAAGLAEAAPRQETSPAGVRAGGSPVVSSSGQAPGSEGQEPWRFIFERLQEGSFIGEVVRDARGVARDWRFVTMNPAWERLSGLSRDACAGRTVSEVIPGIEPEWITDYVRVVETGATTSFTRKVGPLGFTYQVRAFRIEDDRFAVLFFEVSGRKRAELRRSALLELARSPPRHARPRRCVLRGGRDPRPDSRDQPRRLRDDRSRPRALLGRARLERARDRHPRGVAALPRFRLLRRGPEAGRDRRHRGCGAGSADGRDGVGSRRPQRALLRQSAGARSRRVRGAGLCHSCRAPVLDGRGPVLHPRRGGAHPVGRRAAARRGRPAPTRRLAGAAGRRSHGGARRRVARQSRHAGHGRSGQRLAQRQPGLDAHPRVERGGLRRAHLDVDAAPRGPGGRPGAAGRPGGRTDRGVRRPVSDAGRRLPPPELDGRAVRGPDLQCRAGRHRGAGQGGCPAGQPRFRTPRPDLGGRHWRVDLRPVAEPFPLRSGDRGPLRDRPRPGRGGAPVRKLPRQRAPGRPVPTGCQHGVGTGAGRRPGARIPDRPSRRRGPLGDVARAHLFRRRRSAGTPDRRRDRDHQAARDGRAAPPESEDGGGRPAHRRPRPRLQQSAHRHFGQPRPVAEARRSGAAQRPRPLSHRRAGGGQARRRSDAPAAGLLAPPDARSEADRRPQGWCSA